MANLTALAVNVLAVILLAGCANSPGADGRYAGYYYGMQGDGGTSLPISPYVPR